MPKRPRQHQLEDLSITKLRESIPPVWVYREKAKDYRIDGEIEIFDPQGHTTGKLFYVQLKGTDAKPSPNALVIRIRLDSHIYFLNLPAPVLLVRYLSRTNALYYRWSHSEIPDSRKKNTSFRITAKNLWGKTTPDEIIRDVEEFYNIHSPNLQFPLSIGIMIEGATVSGLPAGLADARIRAAAEKIPHLLSLRSQEDTDPNWQIEIKHSAITVILGGLPSGTAISESDKANTDAIGQDVFTVLGLGLAFQGHFDKSAQLLAEYAPQSTVIRSKDIGVLIIRILLDFQQFDAARTLVQEYTKRPAYLPIASFVVGMSMVMRRSKRSLDEVRSLALFVLDAASEHGIPGLAAAMHYNLANSYRSSNEFRKAIHHYNKARKSNQDYCDREYFMSEVAGVLFETKHFSHSAEWYRKAKEISESILIPALHADAVMFAGRYDEAMGYFDEYLAGQSNDSASELCNERDEWHLKYHMMVHIVKSMGIKEQTRNTKEAVANVERGINNPAQMRDSLMRALKEDALCGLAWFNMGQHLVNVENDRKAAVYCYLFTGLTQTWDVEAWVNATFLGMQELALDVIQQLICVAYAKNREAYIEEVVKFTERQNMEADTKVDLINSFVDMCNKIPKEQEPVEIRSFVSDDESRIDSN